MSQGVLQFRVESLRLISLLDLQATNPPSDGRDYRRISSRSIKN